ncbi:hypothetical protein M493_15370 [Geobacillus genomosp. 3]|uniref:Uncharacterized protein n=1 Tax=Geobacillus genomosp. 3 TaxID=1921421 RepID=S5ZG10_GEOG3|nr:hypothetical protein M493_15370 [Geobacillus genomosp. 3]
MKTESFRAGGSFFVWRLTGNGRFFVEIQTRITTGKG